MGGGAYDDDGCLLDMSAGSFWSLTILNKSTPEQEIFCFIRAAKGNPVKG